MCVWAPAFVSSESVGVSLPVFFFFFFWSPPTPSDSFLFLYILLLLSLPGCMMYLHCLSCTCHGRSDSWSSLHTVTKYGIEGSVVFSCPSFSSGFVWLRSQGSLFRCFVIYFYSFQLFTVNKAEADTHTLWPGPRLAFYISTQTELAWLLQMARNTG